MRRFLCLIAPLLAIGCVDSVSSDIEVSETPAPATKTAVQPVLDDGPNWLVAGGPGLVELVGGTDGEPDALTGRFALEGREVFDAASAHGKWVVAGAGLTQPLDDDAVRLREARTALSGGSITFIEPGPTGFVIGGEGGVFQRLDAEGEPTATEITILNGSQLTAAAFNGASWLVGGANGNIVVVNTSLAEPTNPLGVPADGGKPIVAVASDPNPVSDFMAFSADSSIWVTAGGTPSLPRLIENGLQITDARFADGKVYVATSDGRVGVADFGPTPSFTFTDVLSGASITKLVTNGTDWVALGADGRARRFDATGQPLGAAVAVSSDPTRGLNGAHWDAAQSEWMIVVGAIGFVAFVDGQLAPPRDLVPVLGGATVRDASAGEAQVIVVGDAGNVQVLDARGAPVSAVETISGAPDLLTAEWNGDAWLVAGSGGVSQRVDAMGAPVGAPQTLLDGATIRFAAWSGEVWLIGGDEGKFQFVRFDGTASGPTRTMEGAQTLHDARWSGIEWLAVGETDAGEGLAAIVMPDPNVEPVPQTIPTGPLFAVDFNGIEWLVGGAGGLIQRLSAQGQPVDAPVDVLTGFDIHSMAYNGQLYTITGEFGALRRLGQDYLPLRTPIALLDRNDSAVVLWTQARGFASGPCLTDELCYQGPCVGGLVGGQCCDTACDKPCESCFRDDTGEPDGTCAPVVEGKRPPTKPGESNSACARQSESTCGFTGVCDGAGACQFYGAEVECAASLCSLGEFTPTAFCGGAGACDSPGAVDCSPYKGCTEDGCLDACTSNQDCVDGFECEGGACVETTPDGGDSDAGDLPMNDDGDGSTGCCSTVNTRGDDSDAALLAALLGLTAFSVRRRSRFSR